MARFVADNFMEPKVIRGKLHSAGLSVRIASWLARPESRTRVAEMCLRTLSWVMAAVGEAQVRRFIRRVGERNLQALPLAPLAGKALEILTEHGRHQDILTQVLRFCIVMLHENRAKIRGRVQQESPWWIPGFVDDKIVKQMLERIEKNHRRIRVLLGDHMQQDRSAGTKRRHQGDGLGELPPKHGGDNVLRRRPGVAAVQVGGIHGSGLLG